MGKPPPPAAPEINLVDASDLRASLVAGWQDFRRAPLLGAAFAAGFGLGGRVFTWGMSQTRLFYTSDAADQRSSVDLGGGRIIKKKNNTNTA